MYVADMFGDAVVFLLLGSVGAAGLMLVLALMPETRDAPAATCSGATTRHKLESPRTGDSDELKPFTPS